MCEVLYHRKEILANKSWLRKVKTNYMLHVFFKTHIMTSCETIPYHLKSTETIPRHLSATRYFQV